MNIITVCRSFIGTEHSNSPVIAWTLGCLLFNFLTYVSLDAMTGKSLKVRASTFTILPTPESLSSGTYGQRRWW